MWCIVIDEIQANVLNLVTDFLTLFCEMDKTFTAEGKLGPQSFTLLCLLCLKPFSAILVGFGEFLV